jgi:hypothetical protein
MSDLVADRLDGLRHWIDVDVLPCRQSFEPEVLRIFRVRLVPFGHAPAPAQPRRDLQKQSIVLGGFAHAACSCAPG